MLTSVLWFMCLGYKRILVYLSFFFILFAYFYDLVRFFCSFGKTSYAGDSNNYVSTFANKSFMDVFVIFSLLCMGKLGTR